MIEIELEPGEAYALNRYWLRSLPVREQVLCQVAHPNVSCDFNNFTAVLDFKEGEIRAALGALVRQGLIERKRFRHRRPDMWGRKSSTMFKATEEGLLQRPKVPKTEELLKEFPNFVPEYRGGKHRDLI